MAENIKKLLGCREDTRAVTSRSDDIRVAFQTDRNIFPSKRNSDSSHYDAEKVLFHTCSVLKFISSALQYAHLLNKHEKSSRKTLFD